MFDTEGLPGLRAVYWRNLTPGVVFVDGVRINDAVPPELRDFPVVTASLRERLRERYQFLQDRSVLIYAPDVGSLSATEISDHLRRMRDAGPGPVQAARRAPGLLPALLSRQEGAHPRSRGNRGHRRGNRRVTPFAHA